MIPFNSTIRIVNFIFDEEKNTIFFMTFSDNRKVKEFEENNQVAFTTVPHNGSVHVRSRGVVFITTASKLEKLISMSKQIKMHY